MLERDLPDPGIESMSSVTPALQVDSLPGNSAGKESACNARDPASMPGSGSFPWRMHRLHIVIFMGFPGGSDGKESTCNAEDLGSIPGLGRPPGGGHGNPL